MVKIKSVITNDTARFSVIGSAYWVIVQDSYLFSHNPCGNSGGEGFRQIVIMAISLQILMWLM